MRGETLAKLEAARAAKRPVALATHLATGAQRLVFSDSSEGELALPPGVAASVQDALARDEARRLETPDGVIFVQPFHPPPRLVIVGAVHIADPLARIAAMAGYGVTIVDPRRAFAASQDFAGAGVAVDDGWPDEALARLDLDARTAVVTLSHDPKLDDPALDQALRSPAFYVGALGSRKTHDARRRRLAARGHDEASLARIRAPVGLDIGARSPAEIAVAVIAEITALRRRGAWGAPHAARIAAIVLAAGRSSRMGTDNKLLAPLGGAPLVTRAVDAALASRAAPVLVVVGHDAERVRAALGDRPVAFVENARYADGLSSSLRAGVAALPAGTDGALVLLADMPRIGAHHVDRLIAAFDPRTGRTICVPTHRAKRGNPVLWGAAFFAEIAGLAGDVGARALLDRHAAQIALVEMEDDAVLRDVDTPEELVEMGGRTGERAS
jgi:CTP:molybdopterin cytidylyltransferase MocA